MMVKLLKVGHSEFGCRGIDGRIHRISIYVTDTPNLVPIFAKYVESNMLDDKSNQEEFRSALHETIDQALEVIFND